MQVGQQVEVHTKFNNSWAPGFEIAEVAATGYRVRRRSDGVVLPDLTGEEDVRPIRGEPIWSTPGQGFNP